MKHKLWGLALILMCFGCGQVLAGTALLLFDSRISTAGGWEIIAGIVLGLIGLGIGLATGLIYIPFYHRRSYMSTPAPPAADRLDAMTQLSLTQVAVNALAREFEHLGRNLTRGVHSATDAARARDFLETATRLRGILPEGFDSGPLNR